MPNAFAYFMLLAWPIVSVVLFRIMSLERALIGTILGGYLLLPQATAFDFPVVPPLDKVSIPNLTVFLICIAMLGKPVSLFPESRIAKMLILIFFLGPFFTVLNNREPILFDVGGIAGLSLYDSVAAMTNQVIFFLPFLIARQFLLSAKAQEDITRMLLLAGLAYSIPMLIEVRLSPQLHTWIYGFFQHDFVQMMRQEGFRPIVFLYHGLWVAFFAMTTLLAALGLWRAARPDARTPYLLAAGYLAVVLVLCKSLGALIYAVCLAPLVLLARQKAQIRIAAVLAVIALLYPLLRGADLVPVQAMVDQAAAIEEDRAASLLFRFNNEDSLLERAGEKPLFGWGMWGRNQIYDPTDGKMLSVTDGRWIIVIGVYGWCGYIGEFGLLALPLLVLSSRTRKIPLGDLPPFVGLLALMLGINMIDLLPNATLTPMTWLVAGSLLGYAERLGQKRNRVGEPDASWKGENGPQEVGPPVRSRTIL